MGTIGCSVTDLIVPCHSLSTRRLVKLTHYTHYPFTVRDARVALGDCYKALRPPGVLRERRYFALGASLRRRLTTRQKAVLRVDVGLTGPQKVVHPL